MVLSQRAEEAKQLKHDLQRVQSLFSSAERELRYEKEKNTDLKRHNTLLDNEKLKVIVFCFFYLLDSYFLTFSNRKWFFKSVTDHTSRLKKKVVNEQFWSFCACVWSVVSISAWWTTHIKNSVPTPFPWGRALILYLTSAKPSRHFRVCADGCQVFLKRTTGGSDIDQKKKKSLALENISRHLGQQKKKKEIRYKIL